MEEKYPTARVIVQYGIFGSLIGTFIGCAIATVFTLGVALLFIPSMLPASLAVGFLPAITTGTILAIRKEKIVDGDASSWIMGTGFWTTTIYAWLALILDSLNSHKTDSLAVTIFVNLLMAIFCGGLGAIASVYTSKMVLPEVNSNKENKR